MLGEASVNVSSLKALLDEARDRRDMFRAANEDSLVPFLYEKRMAELDAEVDRLERELRMAEQEYEEVLDRIVATDLACDDDPDPFAEEFDELARVEGIRRRRP